MTDPGLPTLVKIVKERLEGDPHLAILFTGGIYDRPLMAAGGKPVYGATPQAFSDVYPTQVRPSLVIKNQPRGPINGYAESHIFEIWIHVPATEDGKAILAEGAERIRRRLNGWHYPVWNGCGGVVSWAGQTGYRDDPVWQNSLVDTLTYQATALVSVPA
jgi:hypothetical protein